MERLLDKYLAASLTPGQVITTLHDKHLPDWQMIIDALPKKVPNDILLLKTLRLVGLKFCEFSGAGNGDANWSENKQIAILTMTCENLNFIEAIKTKIIEWSRMTDRKKELEEMLLLVYSFCEEILNKLPELGRDVLFNLISTIAGVVWITLHLSNVDEALLRGFRSLEKRIERKGGDGVRRERERVVMFKMEEEDRLHEEVPPEDFREVELIPCINEFFEVEGPFLRPNKVSGGYKGGYHYLDVQFRLLREDFVQPLREGVREFVRRVGSTPRGTKTTMPKDSTVRVYSNLTLKHVEKSTENGEDYLFVLPKEATRSVNWDKSKRLLPGCLVMLTSDNCKTGAFAITLAPPFERGKKFGMGDSRRRELSNGIVRLAIETNKGLIHKSKQYSMFECEAYYEAYKHNLKILQGVEFLDEVGGIGAKYIVGAGVNVCVEAPAYLRGLGQRKVWRLPLPGVKVEEKKSEWVGDDDVMVCVKEKAKPVEVMHVPVGDTRVWDAMGVGGRMGLNEYQYEALKMALTCDIALIQGPPGTGKTFVGLQIVKTLHINMRSVERVGSSPPADCSDGVVPRTPILVLCYTNHALDQFLELLLGNIDDLKVVRVGGQCKSEGLQECTLARLRREAVRKLGGMPRGYLKYKYEEERGLKRLERVRGQVLRVRREIEVLEGPGGVVRFHEMGGWGRLKGEVPLKLYLALKTTDWLGLDPKKCKWFKAGVFDLEELIGGSFHKSVEWLREHLGGIVEGWRVGRERSVEEEVNTEEFDMDELLEQRVVEEDERGRKDDGEEFKESLYFSGYSVKSCGVEAGVCEERENVVEWENRGRFFEAVMALNGRRELGVEGVVGEGFTCRGDVGWMDVRFLWGTYFKVVQIALRCERELLVELENELVETQKGIDEAREKLYEAREVFLKEMENLNAEILRGRDIIGMTTTGAAKNHSLLEKAGAKIVIVEEAAEILEAHIVTALTRDCQQLILIGDHRQLRPSTTVYELGRKYRMNVSLFERLVGNGVGFCTLKTQHRMRPEISSLITGSIYEELFNHERVMGFEGVRGVVRSLFFVDHKEREDSDADLVSKSNKHEASFIVELCGYLVQQGYSRDKITILTMYTGQMFMLKRMAGRMIHCMGVRITCVDNYQGEENDIILLSLVRSNNDNNVGFVGLENRVCVALSRARIGMYVIGNMGCLTGGSSIWRKVYGKLKRCGGVGGGLELWCEKHGKKSVVGCGKDFEGVRGGGCGSVCGGVLPCGHECVLGCHRNEDVHLRVKCVQLVEGELKCGHVGMVPCGGGPHDVVCNVPVEKFLGCGHKKLVKCPEPTAVQVCYQDVEIKFECGHEYKMACNKLRSTTPTCSKKCNAKLKCGHNCDRPCHPRFDPNHNVLECLSKCDRKCPRGHRCRIPHQCNRACPPCAFKVPRKLGCRHTVHVECYKDVDSVVCDRVGYGVCGGCRVKCDVRCDLNGGRICDRCVVMRRGACLGDPRNRNRRWDRD